MGDAIAATKPMLHPIKFSFPNRQKISINFSLVTTLQLQSRKLYNKQMKALINNKARKICINRLFSF